MEQADLTRMYDDNSEAGMRSTPKGMAHWSGGRPGKRCRSCGSFRSDPPTTGDMFASVKGFCAKYVEMTVKKSKTKLKFSDQTAACKYYLED